MTTRVVKLIAKTRRARERLHEIWLKYRRWDGKWYVLETMAVRKEQRGPWLLIAPVGHPWDKSARWVHGEVDEDFIVKDQPDNVQAAIADDIPF